MTNALVAAPVKIHAAIIRGKLALHLARIELEPGKIVVHQFSRWLMGFGLIGILIARKAQGKCIFALELSNIAVIGRGKFGLNKKVLEVTMFDGEHYRFSISDAKADLIRNHLAQWSQLVEAGPDKWQVIRRTELPPLAPTVAQA